MKTKEEILAIIEEEDIEFIRLQFVDIFGNLKNIAVTSRHIENAIEKGFAFDASALFDGLYKPEEHLYLHPDLDSFVLIPWRPQQGKVGRFICDVCDKDGHEYELNPRTILKKVVSDAEAEGYKLTIAPECEFFLFHTDENGVPTTLSHEKAGYFDVGPIDLGENARRDMVLALEDMGFAVETSHHEAAPAQHEIDFAKGEPLDIADSLVTFKFAVRSIAKRFGLHATFMPKPRAEVAGSGMHLNFALYKDGVNLFNGEKDEPSIVAKQFMGGVLDHVRELCAITNPTVNSYKRTLAEDATLVKWHKLFENTKVELQFPDPSSNPYLAIAVTIAAGLDGVRRASTTYEKKDVNKTGYLPGTLKAAVEAMDDDSFMQETLGEALVMRYGILKKEEWDDYMTQVSDWEINKYLVKM